MKLVITIEGDPKTGEDDRLFAALWKALKKHATKKTRSLRMDYVRDQRNP